MGREGPASRVFRFAGSAPISVVEPNAGKQDQAPPHVRAPELYPRGVKYQNSVQTSRVGRPLPRAAGIPFPRADRAGHKKKCCITAAVPCDDARLRSGEEENYICGAIEIST